VLIWLILVAAIAVPAVKVLVPMESTVPGWAGVVTGVVAWTAAMVALERRKIQSGRRDARQRLRVAAGAFAVLQCVAAITAPSVVMFMYIPAMFLLTFGVVLSWAGVFGMTLAIMIAGGVEAAVVVLALAGLGIRIGWRTEFD
jgi:hypothetical protein